MKFSHPIWIVRKTCFTSLSRNSHLINHLRLRSRLRAIALVILVGLLTACSLGQSPSQQLVERAISIQVGEAQALLSQQLRLNPSQPLAFEIDRVVVKEHIPLEIQHLSAYRVRGTYDVTLKLPKRQVTQRQNPFDLYLQQQKEGKTWRLARLQPGDEETHSTWVTQLVPLS